jgi:hypothetical protein
VPRQAGFSVPPSERFHDKYAVDAETGCWNWTAAVNNKGYGRIGAQCIDGKPRGMVYAHRVSYEMHHGPIPDGLVIDHLCRNRRCVNPAHLEAVTYRENALRGEAPMVLVYLLNRCPRGHDMSDAYVRPDNGKRQCRTCIKERGKRQRRSSAA